MPILSQGVDARHQDAARRSQHHFDCWRYALSVETSEQAARRAFSWDSRKSDLCQQQRGFDFYYAALLFSGPVLERIDCRKDYGEPRLQAIGHIDGLLYVVVYTMRGEWTHIISARRAHRKEWERWLR